MSDDTQLKIDTANVVLSIFAKDTAIEKRTGGIWVLWKQSSGKQMERRWQCRRSSFYPVWHRHWGHGGTATTALAQLIRWVQGKPVLPLSTWHYWGSDKVYLGSLEGPKMADELQKGGYPDHANCVLCGKQIEGRFDWWDLNKVSGPCCHWTSGCRQKALDGKHILSVLTTAMACESILNERTV